MRTERDDRPGLLGLGHLSVMADAIAHVTADDPDGEHARLASVLAASPAREIARLVAAADDLDRRSEIASALFARADATSVALELTASERGDERAVGVALLGQLEEPSERGTAIVVRALGDRDERVVAEAALAISHLAEDASMPAVMALASHPSALVRLGVAGALARRASSDPDAYVPALIALSRDDDHWVRSWATFGLACADDGRDELREALVERASDDDAEMRGEALEGLASLRDPRGVELLAASLERGASELTTPMLTAAMEHPSRALVPVLTRLHDELLAAHHDGMAEQVAQALEACVGANERIEG